MAGDEGVDKRAGSEAYEQDGEGVEDVLIGAIFADGIVDDVLGGTFGHGDKR